MCGSLRLCKQRSPENRSFQGLLRLTLVPRRGVGAPSILNGSGDGRFNGDGLGGHNSPHLQDILQLLAAPLYHSNPRGGGQSVRCGQLPLSDIPACGRLSLSSDFMRYGRMANQHDMRTPPNFLLIRDAMGLHLVIKARCQHSLHLHPDKNGL